MDKIVQLVQAVEGMKTDIHGPCDVSFSISAPGGDGKVCLQIEVKTDSGHRYTLTVTDTYRNLINRNNELQSFINMINEDTNHDK